MASKHDADDSDTEFNPKDYCTECDVEQPTWTYVGQAP